MVDENEMSGKMDWDDEISESKRNEVEVLQSVRV